MWEALNRVCTREDRSMNQLVTAIAGSREQSTLTAAIRVFLLSYYQAAATDEGRLRSAAQGCPVGAISLWRAGAEVSLEEKT